MLVEAAQVGSERRLAVGSRRHEVEPAARAEQAGAEAATRSRPSYSKGIGMRLVDTRTVEGDVAFLTYQRVRDA